MDNDRTLRKFCNTFNHYPVSDEWREELERYIIRGLPPGGFHNALYENDLYSAALRSHPLNRWDNIQYFMRWLGEYAPPGSFGYKGCTEYWVKLSPEERRTICETKGILDTIWELLQD